jgi:hypothetical protein
MPDRIIRADLTDISNIVTPPGSSHRKNKSKHTGDSDKVARRRRKKRREKEDRHKIDKLA